MTDTPQELETVSREKSALERRAPPAVFVSTDSAIVQVPYCNFVDDEVVLCAGRATRPTTLWGLFEASLDLLVSVCHQG